MDSRPPDSSGGWLHRRIRGFADAGNGLRWLIVSEPHARIHAAATVLALALGAWLRIERWEWCAVVLSIGLVWSAEALNTALEKLCDKVHPGRDSLIGRAKDLAAGGVLAAAIAAATVGAIVFLPRLCVLFGCR